MGTRTRARLQDSWEEGTVAVSSYSFWEIGLLRARGRLDLKLAPRAFWRRLRSDGLRVVPVDAEIALQAAELEGSGFHPDSADRIIAATALVGGYRLATADRKITAWAGRSRLLATVDPTD